MTLFGFGRKKEKKNVSISANNSGNLEANTKGNLVEARVDAQDGICCIKVLGAGCASCHKLYENAKTAARSIQQPIQVEYVTDMQKIMKYGAMSMPVLVVDEKVVSTGKVLKPTDIETILHKLGF